jgi:putative peptidoglycan lipid II flippase
VTAASVLMGLVVAAGSHFRGALEAPFAGTHGAKEIVVLAVAIVGALTYPVFLFALGGVTVAEARAALKRRR